MTRMPRTLRKHYSSFAAKAVSTVLLLLNVQNALADAYADARAELVAAYQAQDYATMRVAAQSALEARPGYPGALFNRALAEVLDDDPESALGTLSNLAAADIDIGAVDIPEFEPLRALPGWTAYAQAVEQLNVPQGSAELAYSHDVGDFVPEGIAVGNSGELYLGSIRHGTIICVGTGKETLSEAAEHWSVFGMRLDEAGGLWFASAAIPEYAGGDKDAGRTGLFRLDLANNEIDVRALLPAGNNPMVLGDLVFIDDDTILTTESLTGALYRYSISDSSFTEIVSPGRLRSMQGLVLDESTAHLYVADYVGGLFRIALANNGIQRVTADNSVSLFGIDGLYRHGNELIAIQNGIRPNRVIGLTLSEDGLSITASRILARNLPEFDEPTLGTIVGDEFYFVANSHWNRFDREGNLPDGLKGPIILKVKISPAGAGSYGSARSSSLRLPSALSRRLSSTSPSCSASTSSVSASSAARQRLFSTSCLSCRCSGRPLLVVKALLCPTSNSCQTSGLYRIVCMYRPLL
jgi:hypothetical protein